ncbi:MAG: guanylate kinase [Clostridiales bacterium]|nr:guanylate kinase [Clostridiales bacterium]
MQEKRRGMLVVISGPSGTGKGTLAHMLLEADANLRFSVSVTTRKPRDYEVEGVHYYFVSDAEYDALLEKDALLEHATVHAHRYGTPRAPIERLLDEGKSVLLDIDPQGAREVIRKCPDCVSIFILPPTYAALRERLHTRNTEDPVEIQRRLNNARGEIEQMERYQYAVVNGDGEEGKQKAYAQLRSILDAERQRTTRYFPVIE